MQTFAFWNEQLTTVISAAQHLASEPKLVEPWDTDDTVKRCGLLTGSLTLMQSLAAPEAIRRSTVMKAQHGLTVLGRGLMAGHPCVIARVNSCLSAAAIQAVEAAALAGAGKPQAQAPGAPARKAAAPAAASQPLAKKAKLT